MEKNGTLETQAQTESKFAKLEKFLFALVIMSTLAEVEKMNVHFGLYLPFFC